MAVWSSFARSLAVANGLNKLLLTPAAAKIGKHAIQSAQMSGHGPKSMFVTPTRFQWHKFKDLVHFYVMLGLIPVLGVVFYTNVFIGPATLKEVPEGYEPKHWEYHRHPISRFLARYLYPSPQQEYEKMLHYLHVEKDKAKIRELEAQINKKMAERSDYQAYYYRPAIAKYHRVSKEAADYLESIRGD